MGEFVARPKYGLAASKENVHKNRSKESLPGKQSLFSNRWCDMIFFCTLFNLTLIMILQTMIIWCISRTTCLVETNTSTPSTCRYVVINVLIWHRDKITVSWAQILSSVYISWLVLWRRNKANHHDTLLIRNKFKFTNKKRLRSFSLVKGTNISYAQKYTKNDIVLRIQTTF